MKTRLPSALLAAAAIPLLFLLGCEESGSGGGSGTWNEPPKPTTTQSASPTTRPSSAPATRSAPTPTTQNGGGGGSGGGESGMVGADQVPFGSLKWAYGGKPNGAGARNGGVVISGARFSEGGVSFTYAKNLSAWGYADNALGGVACLFVQKSNGQWVGGKFDWISSSRKSRDFANVYGGYEGWSLAGVPNPCTAAFVIISPDGKRRSNAIVGTWRHR
jgi:hypothetical protein